MKNKLKIIRGWSGSGKTTLAKKFEDYVHLETDMYFSKNGEDKFDPKKLSEAHKWCQDEVFENLQAGRNVVVSNTFTRVWEMQYYLDLKKY